MFVSFCINRSQTLSVKKIMSQNKTRSVGFISGCPIFVEFGGKIQTITIGRTSICLHHGDNVQISYRLGDRKIRQHEILKGRFIFDKYIDLKILINGQKDQMRVCKLHRINRIEIVENEDDAIEEDIVWSKKDDEQLEGVIHAICIQKIKDKACKATNNYIARRFVELKTGIRFDVVKNIDVAEAGFGNLQCIYARLAFIRANKIKKKNGLYKKRVRWRDDEQDGQLEDMKKIPRRKKTRRKKHPYVEL